jgi:hypothetical protein
MATTTKTLNRLRIESVFSAISDSLFTVQPRLAPSRIQHALRLLCKLINQEEDTETLWYLGECSHCCLADLIPGAYWYFTDYHEGQASESYATLCSLGSIFSPGMSSLDEDSPEFDVYQALETYLA